MPYIYPNSGENDFDDLVLLANMPKTQSKYEFSVISEWAGKKEIAHLKKKKSKHVIYVFLYIYMPWRPTFLLSSIKSLFAE